MQIGNQTEAGYTISSWTEDGLVKARINGKYSKPVYYFVTCIQQWGYIPETSASSNTRSQSLSISFTNTNYIVYREMNSTNTGTTSAVYINSFGIISREATSFSFRYPSHNAAYSGRFIALGFQQWGKISTDASGSFTLKYPISLTTACYSFIIPPAVKAEQKDHPVPTPGLSSCSVVTTTTSATYNWFLVGSQSGYAMGTQNCIFFSHIANFPNIFFICRIQRICYTKSRQHFKLCFSVS